MASKKNRKKQKSGLKPGVIAFGVTLLAYSVFFGLYTLSDYLLGGGLALLASGVVNFMSTPMKGLHPEEEAEIDPESITDQRAKDVVSECMELLRQIRAERDALNEYVFTRRINELNEKCSKMLNLVLEDPDKANRMRKFMNYYLPTTLKLLQNYRSAKSYGASYTEIASTREQIQQALDMILQAAQKQLDAMLKDDLVDMSIDVDVLKQMLTADGLVDSELKKSLDAQKTEEQPQPVAKPQYVRSTPPQPAAAPVKPAEPVVMADPAQPAPEKTPRPELKMPNETAAAKQLGQGSPVLNVPETEDEEEFESFFKDHPKTML